MRRLSIDQSVALDLETDEDALDCTVRSVDGGSATLTIHGPLTPKTVGRLAGGSPCYLLFSYRGAHVGLRGTATFIPGKPDVEFRVTDGIQLPERRGAGRITIATRAIVTPDPDGAAGQVETTTVNVSISGALLRRQPRLAEVTRFAIDLYFGLDPTPVQRHATLVRSTLDSVAVHFDETADGDKQRLGEFLAGHRIASKMADAG
jgi:hypothetical protein